MTALNHAIKRSEKIFASKRASKHGTPDEVCDELLQFRETTGAFNHLVYAGHDWVDPDLARRSMQLMAE